MKKIDMFPGLDISDAEKKNTEDQLNELIQRVKGRAPINMVTDMYYVGPTNYEPDDNHACHAGLGNGKGLYFVHNRLPYTCGVSHYGEKPSVDKKIRQDMSRRFIDWCINRGPYSEWIFQDDVDEVFDTGYTTSTNHPANHLLWLYTQIRTVVEFIPRLVVWNELTANGMGEDLAFLVCHFLTPHESNFRYLMGNYGHSCLADDISLDTLDNFINRTPTITKGMLFNGGARYGVSNQFTPDRDIRKNKIYLGTLIKESIKKVSTNKSKVGYISPFQKTVDIVYRRDGSIDLIVALNELPDFVKSLTEGITNA